jgi:hypothetical protein
MAMFVKPDRQRNSISLGHVQHAPYVVKARLHRSRFDAKPSSDFVIRQPVEQIFGDLLFSRR